MQITCIWNNKYITIKKGHLNGTPGYNFEYVYVNPKGPLCNLRDILVVCQYQKGIYATWEIFLLCVNTKRAFMQPERYSWCVQTQKGLCVTWEIFYVLIDLKRPLCNLRNINCVCQPTGPLCNLRYIIGVCQPKRAFMQSEINSCCVSIPKGPLCNLRDILGVYQPKRAFMQPERYSMCLSTQWGLYATWEILIVCANPEGLYATWDILLVCANRKGSLCNLRDSLLGVSTYL